MADFTLLVQRANATATAWYVPEGNEPVTVEAADAVSAAVWGLRELKVYPKFERLLLWEGREMSGPRRIFHSGS